MFILDGPYVSDYLKESIVKYNIPVLKTDYSKSLIPDKEVNFVLPSDLIKFFANGNHPLLYSNTENAIGWISRNLHFTELPDKIDLFKDRVRFREFLSLIFISGM